MTSAAYSTALTPLGASEEWHSWPCTWQRMLFLPLCAVVTRISVGSPMMHALGLDRRVLQLARARRARRGSRPPRHRTAADGRASCRLPRANCFDPGQRDGDEALHVAGAAAVQQAVLLGDGPGIGRPILAVDRHHVGVAGEADARHVGGADGGVEIGLLAGRVRHQLAGDAEMVQVVAHEVDQFEVGVPAGRVHGNQTAQHLHAARIISHDPLPVDVKGDPATIAPDRTITSRTGSMLPLADLGPPCAGRAAEPRPTGPALPLVFDSPHSGRDYPEDFGHAVPVDLLRRAEDAFVDELIESAPATAPRCSRPCSRAPISTPTATSTRSIRRCWASLGRIRWSRARNPRWAWGWCGA